MDIEWSKSTEEKAVVKDVTPTPLCIPTEQGEISVNHEPAKAPCEKSKDNSFSISTTEQLLSLMNIYQSEWAHYDDVVWKHAFTWFGFILTFMVFPFATPWFKESGLAKTTFLPWLFPTAGIILAIMLSVVMCRYAKRMSCCSKVYRDLIDKLPDDDFREKRINKNGKPSITMVVGILMGIFLVSIAGFILYSIPQWLETIA